MNLGPLTLDAALARRVAVWGMGAEGLALVTLAVERGVEPMLIDDLAADAAERVAAALGGSRSVSAPGDVDWSTVDVVVRAPGVSRYRAELAAAESAGATVTTAMALWLEDHADAPVLAITGTKGKSTTAAMAAAILEADGRRVELVGNIGIPVVDTYRRPRPDAYVVEVSSYQAADVTRSPGVVVLTSLAPDHLDWHGGVDAYYRDKLRLVEAGPPGRLAVNAGNDEALDRTAGHPDRTLFGPDGRVRVDGDGWIEVDGTDVVDTNRLRVTGRHNAWNLCGAITGILLLTDAAPSTPAVESAVDGFAGLPSRCQVLGERDGRTYVDDALASNPFAAATSVESFAGRPLTVIVGGADRGVDPGPLADALAAHRPAASVVLLPPGSVRLRTALVAAVTKVRSAADLDEAVEIAEGLTAPGGVVLFSPGAPTPEGGGGYRSRSRSFATAAGFDAG
ncbi:MAG TPA: UDP-N-acetylmuramoyl-L-alanine--D-glutamate ligase [Acidimicrobiales bacterium]